MALEITLSSRGNRGTRVYLEKNCGTFKLWSGLYERMNHPSYTENKMKSVQETHMEENLAVTLQVGMPELYCFCC